jgi:hypothetical protein
MPTKPTKSTTKTSKPIRCYNINRQREGVRASVWDFLCKVYEEDLDSNFGRKLFEKLEPKFADIGGLKALCSAKSGKSKASIRPP